MPPGQVPKFNKMAAIGTPTNISFMVKTIGKKIKLKKSIRIRNIFLVSLVSLKKLFAGVL